MLEPVSLLIVPVVVVLIGLIIEYFVIQPLCKSGEQTPSPKLQNRIGRILYSSISFNSNRISAKFIENFGYFLVALPLLLASLLATLVAIPFFMLLYITEKLGACRYQPTCREYLVRSIELRGPLAGLWLGFVRVVRCNPFVRGGSAPVPAPEQKNAVFEATTFDPSRLGHGLRIITKGILFVLLIDLVFARILERLGLHGILSLVSGIPAVAVLLVMSITALSLLWIFGFLLVGFLRSSWLVVLAVTGAIVVALTRI
jgi:putative membrane protein insertion efficiency factor